MGTAFARDVSRFRVTFYGERKAYLPLPLKKLTIHKFTRDYNENTPVNVPVIQIVTSFFPLILGYS